MGPVSCGKPRAWLYAPKPIGCLPPATRLHYQLLKHSTAMAECKSSQTAQKVSHDVIFGSGRAVGHSTKKPIEARAITAVARTPPKTIQRGNVRWPIIRGFIAIIIMIAISGAASIPLTTALQ